MVTTLLQYLSFRRQGCTDDTRTLMTAVLLLFSDLPRRPYGMLLAYVVSGTSTSAECIQHVDCQVVIAFGMWTVKW